MAIQIFKHPTRSRELNRNFIDFCLHHDLLDFFSETFEVASQIPLRKL